MSSKKWDADVVIIGGGLSACAMAAALADGRRKIVMVEARKGKNPRFNGELIHPTGVDVLDARGFLQPLFDAGAAQMLGFAAMPHQASSETGDGAWMLLPYREIPGSRPYGIGVDHHVLVDTLRRLTLARAGIELRLGERVNAVVRDEERVTGVVTTAGTLRAPLVIACDGRHSKARTLFGLDERARLISYSAAALLTDCELPHAGHGHIFLAPWGPSLAYPISATSARAVIDLPLDMDRGGEAVVAAVREHYLPHMSAGVQKSMRRALDAGEIEIAANYSIQTDECVVPGAALVGDACGCSHPLTATGMTVALTDTRLLAEALAGLDLTQPNAVDEALERYQRDRYRYVRAREVLADALYEVFAGIDDGTRAIRAGIFDYWRRDVGHRARSMALLSGAESRLPAFLREYLTVVGLSTRVALRGEVNEPSLVGRMRSLIGLGKKSVEKAGIVARGVRQGQFSVS
jgi:2-polyprenyl-6-methoxyphenol hydroxylase-like FAD-dependent oxidoreductase